MCSVSIIYTVLVLVCIRRQHVTLSRATATGGDGGAGGAAAARGARAGGPLNPISIYSK